MVENKAKETDDNTNWKAWYGFVILFFAIQVGFYAWLTESFS
jgi:hypothetical protein|tara:strand:+ start:326 stop:451 length:126 start_codon:yes stop_codon:yes gene_type:complete